jgi:O-antigen ligase
MPEYLRAYIVVVFVSSVAFFLAKKLSADFITTTQFKKWKNSWLIITSLAFLSFNFWVFSALTFLFVAIKRLREHNPIAFYIVILFAVPPISQNIPGFGLISYLINIDYLKIVSLAILLPIAIQLMSSKGTLKLGAVKTDTFLIVFVLVNVGLQFRDTTATDALRQSVVILIQNFLPYYVISRSLKSIEDIKQILVAFMIASIPAAFVGIFEFAKHWLLYNTLEAALHVHWGYGGYLGRDGGLRAIASLGHPIIFGYFMTVALGVYLYLKDKIKSNFYRKLGLGIILLGLIAPLSRGPWVGAAVMYGVYLLLGKNGIANAIKFGVAGIFSFAMATQLPGGEKLINLIPFIGKTEQFNVEYREKLIDVSLLVVAKYPFFGKVEFRKEPEMKQMVQGEGIIDIVNTYISVMLSSGYVGLFSFLGIFISCLILTYSTARKIRTTNEDAYQLGRMLISTIIGIMIIITTVGDQLSVSYIYFMLIGSSVAYCNLIRKA